MRAYTLMISLLLPLLPAVASAQGQPPTQEQMMAQVRLGMINQMSMMNLMKTDPNAGLVALGLRDSSNEAGLAEKILAQPAGSLAIPAMVALSELDQQMAYIGMGAAAPATGNSWQAQAGGKIAELRESSVEMKLQAMNLVMNQDVELAKLGFGIVDSVERDGETPEQQRAEAIIKAALQDPALAPRVRMGALAAMLESNKPLAMVALGANGASDNPDTRAIIAEITPTNPAYQAAGAMVLIKDNEELLKVALGLQDTTSDTSEAGRWVAQQIVQLRPFLRDPATVVAISRNPNLARRALGLIESVPNANDVDTKVNEIIQELNQAAAVRTASATNTGLDFLNGSLDPNCFRQTLRT